MLKIRGVTFVAADFAAFELARVDPQFNKNPAEPLFYLMLAGLKPKGFKLVDGQERLVIDFPIRHYGGKIMGCWANGDSKINFYHYFQQRCKDNRPFEPSRRITNPPKSRIN